MQHNRVALHPFALGRIFIVATLHSVGCIVVVAAAFSAYLKRSATAQRILNCHTDTVFLGAAARLEISQR